MASVFFLFSLNNLFTYNAICWLYLGNCGRHWSCQKTELMGALGNTMGLVIVLFVQIFHHDWFEKVRYGHKLLSYSLRLMISLVALNIYKGALRECFSFLLSMSRIRLKITWQFYKFHIRLMRSTKGDNWVTGQPLISPRKLVKNRTF